MTPEAPDWLDLLRTRTEAFAGVISDADLDAPVPSCPGWSLRDLATHLGEVHQWAAHCVLEGDPSSRPEVAVVEVLTATPAHAPAWTFDERDATALSGGGVRCTRP